MAIDKFAYPFNIIKVKGLEKLTLFQGVQVLNTSHRAHTTLTVTYLTSTIRDKKSEQIIKEDDKIGIYFMVNGSTKNDFHLSILLDPDQIQNLFHSRLWIVPNILRLEEKTMPYKLQNNSPSLSKT